MARPVSDFLGGAVYRSCRRRHGDHHRSRERILSQGAVERILPLAHWRVAGIRALPQLDLDTSEGPKLAYAIPIFAGTMVAIWLK